MAVEGVNQNSNTGLYTGIGTLTGAGIGATAGYFTKPLMKNEVPTDSFIKEFKNQAIKSTDEDLKNSVKIFNATINSNLEGSKNVKDLIIAEKDIIISPLECLNIDEFKEELSSPTTKDCKYFDKELREKLTKANSMDEVLEIMNKNIESKYDGKTLEEAKKIFKKCYGEKVDTFLKEWISGIFDKNSGKFLETVEESDKPLLETCKKVAKVLKGKAAALYGTIGAISAGVGTYFICKNKTEKSEDKQS